ncbi:Holliday junction resolvase RecU [Bacillus velezensis]|uniref:Holliday junction resolvase RecU n=1 Tax=Bacillus velezensis TaxID=492670 RepID=UPI002ADD65A3|nr:Holliday junction resolvase RecU [Bacillus velezensis]MEA1004972.1 Holliday junction resolvase RecU [Bacillus velezensis]
MGGTNQGKVFEANIEKSAADQKLFFYRIKDVNPMFLKKGAAVSKNKYDCFLHFKGYLFPFELKSTKNKSVSFSEKIIKPQQIKHLKEAAQYPNIIPGFLFQFREPENEVYFVHINDFLTYKTIAENQLPHTYKNKVNKSSIPISICEEIGTEIRWMKKKVNYTYYLNKLCDDLIKRSNALDNPNKSYIDGKSSIGVIHQ